MALLRPAPRSDAPLADARGVLLVLPSLDMSVGASNYRDAVLRVHWSRWTFGRDSTSAVYVVIRWAICPFCIIGEVRCFKCGAAEDFSSQLNEGVNAWLGRCAPSLRRLFKECVLVT